MIQKPQLGKTLKSCEMKEHPDNMCCISIVAMKREAKPAIDKTNELWLRYIAASAQKYTLQHLLINNIFFLYFRPTNIYNTSLEFLMNPFYLQNIPYIDER